MTTRIQIRLTSKQRRELIAAVEAAGCSIGKSTGAIYEPNGQPAGLVLESLVYSHGRRNVTNHWLHIDPTLMCALVYNWLPEEMFPKGTLR